MEFRRRVLVVAIVATAALLALVVLAPCMAPYGSFRHLDGTPSMIDGGWEGHGLASAVYALGDFFCHQEEARSFFLNGSQLPFCVRDVGILVGLPVGFVLCLALGDRLSDRRIAWIGVILVLLMGAEWLYETTGADIAWLRFASGLSAGVGAALFLGWLLFREDGEITRTLSG